MIFVGVKAVLWGVLTAAYHRPWAVMDMTMHLTLGSPFVLPVYAEQIMNASRGEIATRAALTTLALAAALARTYASPRYFLVITGLLIAVNAFAVYLASSNLPIPAVTWSPSVQQAAISFLATGSYSLLLAVGFFAPIPDSPHALRQKKYRDQLIAFYATNNPSKLDDVDDLLRRYRFHEEVLFTRLKKKYLEGYTKETVDSGESSDEDTEEGSQRELKQAPQVGTSIQHDNVADDSEDEEEAGPFVRADIAPIVQNAIEEVRAEQDARIEARIRRMKK